MSHVMRFILDGLIVLGGVLVLGSMCWAPPVAAHTKKGDEWYFIGRTYEDRDNSTGGVKDPVNWIFTGAGSDITNTRVGTHIIDDWRYGSMDGRFCKDSQRMVWRNLRGETKTDKEDRHRMTNCFGRQYHTRLWDDYEHDLITDHRRYSWVVGGVHHEKIVSKLGPGPRDCCVGHSIDRGWNRTRHEAIKAMNKHCTQYRWRFHAGARKKLQGYRNSGWIARIAIRHRTDGCRGA